MKAIYDLIKNIRNTVPYLILILIYFLFINIEAKKDKNSQEIIENEYRSPDGKSNLEDKVMKIEIPVIPFKEQ